jgi:hypothetical protein
MYILLHEGMALLGVIGQNVIAVFVEQPSRQFDYIAPKERLLIVVGDHPRTQVYGNALWIVGEHWSRESVAILKTQLCEWFLSCVDKESVECPNFSTLVFRRREGKIGYTQKAANYEHESTDDDS